LPPLAAVARKCWRWVEGCTSGQLGGLRWCWGWAQRSLPGAAGGSPVEVGACGGPERVALGRAARGRALGHWQCCAVWLLVVVVAAAEGRGEA